MANLRKVVHVNFLKQNTKIICFLLMATLTLRVEVNKFIAPKL